MSLANTLKSGIEIKYEFNKLQYVHHVIPGEIDQFKVVHYSRYYEWISASLLKFLKDVNIDFINRPDYEIRVAKVQAVYLNSAKMNDEVHVGIRKLVIYDKYMHVSFRIIGEDEKILMRAKLIVALVDRNGVLTEMPDSYIESFCNLNHAKGELQ